ncbi:protein of unknown function [Candidatus Nitrotoga arctica]|uniref:Integrase catalytic domain-containing protein n=1 Tax=Candidatus Nitrotoga arctica TaxID=453162 RepID=A0ABM8YX85_9PROT|nr:hypothetical protein [Candidatus Nitrotoga arctica]CAG9932117.1 protein of unknown function [Candidatus Nitrotoga arctica]
MHHCYSGLPWHLIPLCHIRRATCFFGAICGTGPITTLIRQYFPKGMELADVTEEQVQRAVERLNHRPRKVLGFRSPHEVLFGVEMRYTKPVLAVALRTESA